MNSSLRASYAPLYGPSRQYPDRIGPILTGQLNVSYVAKQCGMMLKLLSSMCVRVSSISHRRLDAYGYVRAEQE